MRDSSFLWYKEFTKTLTQLHLIASKEEPCMFFDQKRKIFVLFFVDDILVLYHRNDRTSAEAVITGIHQAYKLREMETVDWFLGVRIIRNRAQGTISLVHDTYIEKIANKFGLTTSLLRSTPLPGIELTKYKGITPFSRVKEY